MANPFIYSPKGRAGEYADLACNVATFCPHRCAYCYVPAMLRKDPEVFHDKEQCRPRKDFLFNIQKEALSHSGKNVFLCFTCDPCHPKLIATTKAAIFDLNRAGCGVTLLTKAAAAMDILNMMSHYPHNVFGMTLTLTDEQDRQEWEPGAATFEQRAAILREAKELSLMTWASLEPVIDPEQTLEIIERTHTYVDHYKVGMINHIGKLPHHLKAKVCAVNWVSFREQAIQLLQDLGCDFYIKQSLWDVDQ